MPSARDRSAKAGTPRQKSSQGKSPAPSDDPPLVLPSHQRSESPDSRVSSARSRRTDPAGLITDLTRLKEITHDARIQSPSYRKLLDDFGPDELPQTGFLDEQDGLERRDTVFFGGDIEGRPQEIEDDIEDIDDELEDEFGEDLDNISSIGSDDEAKAAEYDTDLEVDAESKIGSLSWKLILETTNEMYYQKCYQCIIVNSNWFMFFSRANIPRQI